MKKNILLLSLGLMLVGNGTVFAPMSQEEIQKQRQEIAEKKAAKFEKSKQSAIEKVEKTFTTKMAALDEKFKVAKKKADDENDLEKQELLLEKYAELLNKLEAQKQRELGKFSGVKAQKADEEEDSSLEEEAEESDQTSTIIPAIAFMIGKGMGYSNQKAGMMAMLAFCFKDMIMKQMNGFKGLASKFLPGLSGFFGGNENEDSDDSNPLALLSNFTGNQTGGLMSLLNQFTGNATQPKRNSSEEPDFFS